MTLRMSSYTAVYELIYWLAPCVSLSPIVSSIVDFHCFQIQQLNHRSLGSRFPIQSFLFGF